MRLTREVVVDDALDALDVEPARGDVGGDDDGDAVEVRVRAGVGVRIGVRVRVGARVGVRIGVRVGVRNNLPSRKAAMVRSRSRCPRSPEMVSTHAPSRSHSTSPIMLTSRFVLAKMMTRLPGRGQGGWLRGVDRLG